MTICYFGDYYPDYARTKILLRGLRENGATVVECPFSQKGKIIKYWRIFRLARKYGNQADIFFAAYSNSRYIWFLKLLTRKPVFWDPFYSLYDNWIFDRALASPRSLKAFYYWFIDWLSSLAADVIVLDTNAHIGYFVRTFRLPRQKFLRVLVGADDRVMYPRERKKDENKFIVFFYGYYIPVHGVEYIIEAAKILKSEKDIVFNLLGKGQEYGKIKNLADQYELENVNFIAPVPYGELPDYIAAADVCLGLLSKVPRAARAIPNKIYDASAMRRASINADTPAIREIFRDRESIMLCRGGDAQDLADKIMALKRDPRLKEKIGENAYRVFRETGTPKAVTRPLVDRIREVLS